MFSKFGIPVAILLAILGVWESAVHLFDIPRYILPAPSKIVVTLFVEHAQLLKHTLVTLEEMLLGFVLAVSIGIPLAVLMFEFPMLEKAFYPYVIGSQTVPVFAIAPLLVLWFGFGIASKDGHGGTDCVFRDRAEYLGWLEVNRPRHSKPISDFASNSVADPLESADSVGIAIYFFRCEDWDIDLHHWCGDW